LDYLGSSYYRRWMLAMERNVTERGYASAEELKAGHAQTPGKSPAAQAHHRCGRRRPVALVVLPAAAGPAALQAGRPRADQNIHPATHTRLPRYARGKLGVVESCHGCHMYPDSVATDRGDNPQWLYTVVFTSQELWGADADPTIKISIDAFEPLSRSGLSPHGHHRSRRRATRHAGRSQHPVRCRRPGVPRAMGGAGLRADAFTLRPRAVRLAGMGRDPRR
jgi:hypothetical protein